MTQQENKGTCSEISLLVLFIELTDQHSMTEKENINFTFLGRFQSSPASDVPVELPLLPEDGVAADVAALVAPLLVLPNVVLHRWDLNR